MTQEPDYYLEFFHCRLCGGQNIAEVRNGIHYLISDNCELCGEVIK